jgi:hypothetical protein
MCWYLLVLVGVTPMKRLQTVNFNILRFPRFKVLA